MIKLEKLKQKLFSLDDEILKPYFQLEKVLSGAFTVAEKLFGITFKEVFDIDKYHDDVQTFVVLDFEGQLVAVFYRVQLYTAYRNEAFASYL